MSDISIIGIFMAGVLSFISPCMIVMLPAYISYFAGYSSTDDTKRLLLRALGFIIGFSIIFIIMGASATALSKVFLSNRVLLRKISGAIIILFGIHMFGLFEFKTLYKERRLLKHTDKSGWLGSLVLGIAFAAGWTPCIGPILTTVLIYAGNTMSVKMGVLYLAVYSLGMSMPLVLSVLLSKWVSDGIPKFAKYTYYIQKAAGILMILLGIMIYTNYVSKFNQYFSLIII